MKSYGLLSVIFLLSAFISSPLLINPVYAAQGDASTDMKVPPKDSKKAHKSKTVMQQNSEAQPSTMKKASDHVKSKPAVSTPAAAPAGNTSGAQGATARCKDGSYSHSQHHSGSCAGHGGVANWLQ